MSQSDYIQFKKTKNQLTDLSRQPSVLNSRDYINFKNYGMETLILGNQLLKPQLNQLIPIGKTTVFDMPVDINCNNISSINSFGVCENTNIRSNRVLNIFKPLKN